MKTVLLIDDENVFLLTIHYQPQFHLKLVDAADELVKGALTHASAT